MKEFSQKLMLSKIRETKGLVLAQMFFYFFIALLPFQINFLLFRSVDVSAEFFNPYVSQFLYLSDILLFISLFFFGVHFALSNWREVDFRLGDTNLFWMIVFFVLSYLGSVYFSVNPVNSLAYFLRGLEFLAVYMIVVNGLVDKRVIQWILISVVSLSAVVGILQYVKQESLGLYLFGEPVISADSKGVAKVAIGESNFLRIYGFFPHPNIFAGYLLFSMFLLMLRMGDKKLIALLLFFLSLIALVLTFSRSGIAAFLIMSFFYFIQKRKLFTYVLLALLAAWVVMYSTGIDEMLLQRFIEGDPLASTERDVYVEISKEMFAANTFGVGAGNFTSVMHQYSDVKLLPWQFQPVHNIYLLVLTELGIQGMLIFTVLIVYLLSRKSKYRPVLLAFALIGIFDHYLLSLPAGNNLFMILLALYFD